MPQKRKLRQMLKDNALVLEGLDEAIAGSSDCGRLIYDFNKVVEVFKKRDGMSEGEAIEFIDYNVMGVQPNGGGFIMMYPNLN